MSGTARLLASGLGIAAFALPNIAASQTHCPVLNAVLADDPSAMEGVAVTVNAAGLIDVTKLGVAGILRDAETCSLTGPEDDFDLDCDWHFEAGPKDQAMEQFENLLDQLNACLPQALKKQAPTKYTAEELEELRQKYGSSFIEYLQKIADQQKYSTTIELTSGNDIDVSLEMRRNMKTGRTSISFNVYR